MNAATIGPPFPDDGNWAEVWLGVFRRGKQTGFYLLGRPTISKNAQVRYGSWSEVTGDAPKDGDGGW